MRGCTFISIWKDYDELAYFAVFTWRGNSIRTRLVKHDSDAMDIALELLDRLIGGADGR